MLELNYKTFGQGPPLVILHGLFGMLDNWQGVARKLADDYSVYLVDQRNHGRSPHHPAMDYPCMAEDLLHFMESQWIFKSHLIGHSMGGKTAMQFALSHPHMVDKLVVVDIAPKPYSGGHQDIFDALLGIDLHQIQERNEVYERLKHRINDYGVLQFLLKNLSRTKKGGYEWKINLPALHQNYENVLASVEGDEPFEGEALFIRGEKSNYIREDDFSLILSLFPNARIETVHGAGHWVHAERPEELLKLVQGFLAGKALSPQRY